MKRIRPDSNVSPPLRPRAAAAVLRSTRTLGATDEAAFCLRCPDEPCLRFSVDESGGGNAISVCPTDAIHGARSATGPSVSNECVGCGLCAIRCPVGALHLTGTTVTVVAPDEVAGRPATSADDFARGRQEITADIDWNEGEWTRVVASLAGAAAQLGQDAFYPLVANLFTAAGHPTWRPARGDTSNRIDLILADEADALPVEVKSGSETPIINVKSVQQALENRIVLDQRAFFPADPTSSSLVVGLAYPPPRSDIAELVADIASAFEVTIGLISLSDLYELAIRTILDDVDVPRTLLSRLQGALS